MPHLSILSGFAIGLAFDVVGLLSGFCLLSSLRDWWTKDDSRKIRSYAVALAVAIIGAQFIGGAGIVDIGESLYLQPSFSAPLMFSGGLLFGLGMVLLNGRLQASYAQTPAGGKVLARSEAATRRA